MILNPKKIIGSLGRRYGGTPFQRIRASYYRIINEIRVFKDTLMIYCGIISRDPVQRHIDKIYYSDYNRPDNGDSLPSIENIESKPEGIICILDGAFTHGGLTDRIRGICSAYEMAKKKQIPFYIYWIHPFKLEKYLLPSPKIDWRITKDDIIRYREFSRMVVADDLTDMQNNFRLRTAIKRRKKQLHLYTNADTARGRYAALFNDLFCPSPALRQALELHLSKMTPGYHAFAFRFLTLLEDFTDFKVPELSKQEQIALMVRVRDELKILIKEVPEDKSIFVTGDSVRFLNFIKDLDPRIYIVEGKVSHIDLDKDIAEESELKTFIDQFLLMKAARVTLLRTGRMYKSGFSRFAAEVGGAEFVDHHF